MTLPRIVVLTGAGMSAESGLRTFRGAGGLWEGVPVTEVATPEGWRTDYKKVLRFYNERRAAVRSAEPNAAHRALVDLEHYARVSIITQNVDNLHERAGSKDVLHLHGVITKSQSTVDPELVYELGDRDIEPGDFCEKGSQLRPFIVWFGESVPMIDRAVEVAARADVLLVIGTSLEVYPAAGLTDCVHSKCEVWLIDPDPPPLRVSGIKVIRAAASEGVPQFLASWRARNDMFG